MTDAKRYEDRHPETGISSAQAAERQQRHDILHGIRSRKVSAVIPALPWLKERG